MCYVLSIETSVSWIFVGMFCLGEDGYKTPIVSFVCMHLHVCWHVMCVCVWACVYVFKYVPIIEREKDMREFKELKKDWEFPSSGILRHMVFIFSFSMVVVDWL